MDSLIVRQNFSPEKMEDIISFSKEFGLSPHRETSLIKRFLLDLTSSPDLVFDLFQDGKRVISAVLIDRAQNGANSANLEIIALRPHENTDRVVYRVLELAKAALPTNRSSVDVTYHSSFPYEESIYINSKFIESYSMYEMTTSKPRLRGSAVPNGYSVSDLTENDFEEYHRVLLEVFKNNEDSNIPPLEEMIPHLIAAKIRDGVMKYGSQIVGFFSVFLNGNNPLVGEVNSIGVLTEHRRQGLGRIIIEKAIERLEEHGAKEFKLSVSVTNQKALGLYTRAGFTVHDCYKNFRFKPD
jgi:ribosomal protein S18 acetylase RimI-like enzyme